MSFWAEMDLLDPLSPVVLPEDVVGSIIEHAREGWPNEICGMVAHKEGEVTGVWRLDNVAETPSYLYLMDPVQQMNVLLTIEQEGWELGVIYHSHPHGPAQPSGIDTMDALWPNAVYVICSLASRRRPNITAWRMAEGQILAQIPDRQWRELPEHT